MGFFDFFSSKKKTSKELNESLDKTKKSFLSKISKAIIGKDKIDDEVLDKLEEILISSDVGVETTVKIINDLEKEIQQNKYIKTSEINFYIKKEIYKLLKDSSDYPQPKIDNFPYIIMVIGVNGVGKTTTIGKLANLFKKNGKSVILGAGDTFRAAAVDQLKLWAERVNVPVIIPNKSNDPSSVAFETVKKAKNENIEIAILDTAGRLHNKVNLMNELAKIKRTIQKFIPEGPHEILLVLDGTTGQNAFSQVKEFKEVTDLDGLVITKLDGTAKGGVIIGISSMFDIPIRYIGLGEKKDDIEIFDKQKFIDGLLD